jgi:hypothetical protein
MLNARALALVEILRSAIRHSSLVIRHSSFVTLATPFQHLTCRAEASP